jgi:hypothetical protein
VARIGKKKDIEDFAGKNSTAVRRIIDIGVDNNNNSVPSFLPGT